MGQIKYGMPQLLELKDIEENVHLCEKLGLDFVELNANLPTCQPDRLNVRYLNRLKLQYGVNFTIHLPEDIDLGHFNRRERAAYLKIIEESIGVADRLGIKVLNLHMNTGIHFTLPEQTVELYEAYKKEYLDNIKACKEAIDLYLGGTGIKIAIENTGILNRPHIQEAVEILLKGDRFCLTWDVGHDYCHPGCDQPFIINHIDKVKHVHLHDAIEQKDHLPLYTGAIDLDEKLQLVEKNNPTVVIEVKTKEALIHSVARLKEKLIQANED